MFRQLKAVKRLNVLLYVSLIMVALIVYYLLNCSVRSKTNRTTFWPSFISPEFIAYRLHLVPPSYSSSLHRNCPHAHLLCPNHLFLSHRTRLLLEDPKPIAHCSFSTPELSSTYPASHASICQQIGHKTYSESHVGFFLIMLMFQSMKSSHRVWILFQCFHLWTESALPRPRNLDIWSFP